MIENFARVARVEGSDAWIEATRPIGCGHCHENPACHANPARAVIATGRPLIRVANPLGALPGEEVVVAVPEAAVWQVTVWVYLLPLLLVLVGALAGAWWYPDQDFAAAALALVGLLLGLVVAMIAPRWRQVHQACRPAIVRRQVAIT